MKRKQIAAVSVLVGLLIAFAICSVLLAKQGYQGTVMALFPPFIAIALALITKEVYSSLFVGVIVGALAVSQFNPVKTLDIVLNDGLISAVSGNAGIFLFLVLLGVIVCLVNRSGGSAAFGRWAKAHVKSRVGTMLAVFALGVLIFIDDYFNCLTVGSVMKTVTDEQRISRAKLAYLIDATAAPICMIAPISSWAAAVAVATEGLDVGYSGIALFVRTIPYNFYSLLTLVFVVALCLMKFDFGPMRLAELSAQLDERANAADTSEKDPKSSRARVIDQIFPIAVLIVTCVIGMVYVGGFFGVDHWGSTDYAGDFVGAFGNTDAFIGLPWGCVISLIVIVIYFVCRRLISFKEAMECVPKGFFAMVPPISILTLAVSLKEVINMLGADIFFKGVMEGSVSGLYSMLPAVVFVAACLLAFSSGTSWGTFSILIPIVAAIFPVGSELLIIGMSACLAGAVCGDHCSPISDTTIMASAGAECDHLSHVSTQLPYAVSVAGISFVTFVIAGFVQNAFISLAIGAGLTVAFLAIMKLVTKKKA